MKKLHLITFASLLLGTLCFSACSSGSKTSDPDDNPPGPNPPGPNPTEVVEGNLILHCFDWSMTNIKNNLQSIKDAGFNMIQISPMQPQKDPYSGNWKSQWWKLYQPLGFKVATGGENKLGTKQELITLCSEADKYGIDVIVDVVANHLASSNKNLYSAVQNYEPEIYSNNLIHQTGKSIDEDVIWGNMGDLCDLKTEDSRVQNRVVSLLKEYVDCGIDGFRFDAAKHIETEFDSDKYKSDFWKNTLDSAVNYAKTQYSKDLFSYGEVLGSVGTGRQYSFYTCRMGITDSDQGSNVLKAARGSVAYAKNTYNTKESPKNLVLWSESHDTYSNDWGESKNDSLETIQKGYIMQASRQDASILYFARPQSSSNLGDVGDTSYRNNEVKAINTFNKMCVGKSESVYSNNGCFVNVRGSLGAVIVRLAGSETAITVSGLANGEYTNLVTGAKVNVTNGVVNFPAGTNYYILINENESTDVTTPSINISAEVVYSKTQNVSVIVKNATTTTYSINGGTPKTLTGSEIVLDSSIPNGKVTLKVTATNERGGSVAEGHLIKTDLLVNKQVIITDCDDDYTYFLWVWTGNQNGHWVSTTVEGDIIGADLGSDNMFIVVQFASGTTSPDWNNKLAQTGDVSHTQRVYSLLDL